ALAGRGARFEAAAVVRIYRAADRGDRHAGGAACADRPPGADGGCRPAEGAPERDQQDRQQGLTYEDILFRGASPLGLPYTRSRAPLRRRAPCAWLTRCARSRLA